MSDLTEFQKNVGNWGVKTFPELTIAGLVAHIKKEILELEEALFFKNKQGVSEEASDLLILLLGIAHRVGFDLLETAEEKFDVLLLRDWMPPDEHGVIEHVRDLPVR
jgi:hypothetical protein